MSKILMNVTMFYTKLAVNTYTAVTLPFYTIYQKPWRRLKLSNISYSQKFVDNLGRTCWARKGKVITTPVMKCGTYIEALNDIDRSRDAVGFRDILDERMDFDENGNPIVIDGKMVKKIKLSDKYRWLTAGEVVDKVDNLAKGFRHMGIQKGDRVIIYADTQVNWFLSCLALGKLNATLVTLYSNLGNSGVIYGMNQSKAKFIITTEDLKTNLLNISDKLPHLETIIYINNKYPCKNGGNVNPSSASITVKTLKEVETLGASLPAVTFELPKPEDMALIMYTSGTTSLPKAVMVTHKSLMANIRSMIIAAQQSNYILHEQILASFLPLAHIFGFVFNVYIFINGGKIGFATPFTLLNSSPSHVPGQSGDLTLLKPNTIVVVPLVLERFQKEIYAVLNKKSSLAAPLFTYFIDYKNRWVSRGFDTPIINRFICSKISEQFGGNLNFIGVGGAPLHAQIQAFSKSALCVQLMNAYGATETCGGVYCTQLDDLTNGNVGVPFEGIKVQLVDWAEGGYTSDHKPNPRGEIVVGGDLVCDGYFEMPEETDEAFKVDKDGTRWFYTGDIGEIEEKTGKLKIIDRKKDLAKLGNGEYVSLGKVESGLRSSRYIENICICTNMYSNNLVALISPNNKVLKELAKSLSKGHLTRKEMCEDPEIHAVVADSIYQTGKRANLKEKEIPAQITLTPEEWSPDNNLLTAAFKLKRKNVNEFYSKDIERMFKLINVIEKDNN